jgi:hypothetical protein
VVLEFRTNVDNQVATTILELLLLIGIIDSSPKFVDDAFL